MTVATIRRLDLTDADYSPDVQIRIRAADPVYEAFCQIGQYPFEFKINLTKDDMKNICHGLQARLEDLRIAFDEGETDTAAQKHALNSLAEEGRNALLRIFAPEKVRQRIESAFLSSDRLIVQFTSEAFSIPWDALYCRDLSLPRSFEYFLGMRHIVSRILVISTNGDDLPPGHLIRTDLPVLGLLSNKELDSLIKIELPFFEGRAQLNQIVLKHLDKELDPDKDGDIQHVRRFLNKRHDILHFACHADYEENSGPLFVITREFGVTLKKLVANKCHVQGNPVIFLNACRTSEVEPTYFSGLARHFLGSGARGLIATECEVPDTFAAEFSKWVYTKFLKGKALGECVFDARRHFLTKFKNPLGLIYSLYGPPSVRLKMEEKTNGSN